MTASGPAASGEICILLAEEVWGSTLHAMRSLDRAGVDVLVVTAGEGSHIYGRSRHCTAALDVHPVAADQFCAAVRAWADEIAPAAPTIVLIPLSDRLLEFTHSERSSFSDRFRLAIPPAETTNALPDKASSLRLAEAAGLDVPSWVPVRSILEVPALEILDLPIAIRPTKWSTVGDDYFKISVHHDRRDLDRAVRAALDAGAEVIAQEYVDADDDAVEFAIIWRSTDGSASAMCTGRKRRQASADGGVMVWGEAVPLPDVTAATLRFLTHTGFTALGGTEFIRANGRLWFIEFNPRLEAIHFLATAAGVDTVRLAFEDLAPGRRATVPTAQRPAAAWIGSAALARVLAKPANLRIVMDRLAFARSPNGVRAVWTWSDPLPGLAIVGRLLHRALRRMRAGTGHEGSPHH